MDHPLLHIDARRTGELLKGVFPCTVYREP
jgi:hypothetical protein